MHYQIYTSSIRSQSAIIQLDRLQSYMNLFRGFSSYALPASDGQDFGAILIARKMFPRPAMDLRLSVSRVSRTYCGMCERSRRWYVQPAVADVMSPWSLFNSPHKLALAGNYQAH